VDRRQRLTVGVGILLFSLAVEAALYTTPLERRALNPASWFVIVMVLIGWVFVFIAIVGLSGLR
jgi:hypothetical protein